MDLIVIDEERDYKEDISLDKSNLEDAAEKQSYLYGYWHLKLAEASRRLDSRKDRLTLICAQVEKALRDDTTKKMTEGALKTQVELDESVVSAKKAVNTAKYAVQVMNAATTALEHKKRMIEVLHRGKLSGFFGDPTGSGITENGAASMRGALNNQQASFEDEE